MRTRVRDEADALELLESEDLELRELFAELRQRRGSSVEDRAEYGDIAKEIVRHVSIREAALVDVAEVASADARLSELASRIEQGRSTSRPHIDRVEKMSRGVQGINLRTGQDFDTEMEELIQLIGTEIEWDLGEAIPELRASFQGTNREEELKSAGHLRKHAPTNLGPKGPRWRERAPVISRIITIYDHLRDFPKSSRRDR
jgi:transcriptional regulator with XRE-family HTH domain